MSEQDVVVGSGVGPGDKPSRAHMPTVWKLEDIWFPMAPEGGWEKERMC